MEILRKSYRKIKSLRLGEKIYKNYYEIAMKMLTHPLGVRFFSNRRNVNQDQRKISLAITHYNRSNLIAGALRNVLFDNRIDDVVIYDDCSSPEEFSKMQAIVEQLSKNITIYKGEKNLGPYHSKLAAIEKCRNEWAVILDSDNSLSSTYIDTLYQISTWNPNLLYCPTFGKPYFNFEHLANIEINLEKAREIILKGDNIKLFRNFMNDGNYFVNVQKYVECGNHESDSVPAADVLVFNYSWLKKGYGLYPVTNLTYYHRVHVGSFQKSTWRVSRQIVDKIIDSIAKDSHDDLVWNIE